MLIESESELKFDIFCSAAFLTKSIHVDDTLFKYQIWDTAGQEKVP